MGETAALFGSENQRGASAGSVARSAGALEQSAGSPRVAAQRRYEDLANRGAQARTTAGYRAMLNAGPGAAALQRKPVDEAAPVQREAEPAPQANHTGLPDGLKAGVESLSGVSLDHVRVHYNSGKPAQLQAYAYTQGAEIHVAPGQERHLPHEAWHAAQQAQGRVPVTAQLKGIGLNTDAVLEAEADVMGQRALAGGLRTSQAGAPRVALPGAGAPIVQRTKVAVIGGEFEDSHYAATDGALTKGAEIVLGFTPKDAVGKVGDTVSLVQTVKDTTKLVNPNSGGDVTPQPTTSLLSTRKLRANDPGVSAGEVGWGVDQEVLNAEATQVRNLDPRYTEQRLNASAPLNTAGRVPGNAWSVRSALKKAGQGWSKAVLNDEPSLAVRFKPPGGHQPVDHTLTGGMDFEVTALHNQTGTYLGSVKWGWKMTHGSATLEPTQLTLGDKGEATATFFKAAQKWNATKIRDPSTAVDHTPMQLPLSQKKSLNDRWDRLTAAVPEDKALGWKFGESYGKWLADQDDLALRTWAGQYLDWVEQQIVAEAAGLDRRWNETIGILDDLANTPAVVKKRGEVKAAYEGWKASYGAAKAGNPPAADVLLGAPKKVLDDVEKTFKGKTQWSAEAVQWKKRKGFRWE